MLLRAMSSDDGDRPSGRLKSPSPPVRVSFRLAADLVRLCRERRECDPPDSTLRNRVQGVASVVRAAESRGPAVHVGSFPPSVPQYHFARVMDIRLLECQTCSL